VTQPDAPPARRVLGKWQYVHASPAADDGDSRADNVYRRITLRRRPRRRLSRGGAALAWMVAVLMVLAGCGSNSHKTPDASAATSAPATSTVRQTTTTTPTTTYATLSAVGREAFLAYQHAFGVIAEIEGTPTGRSTDTRLRSVLIDPWFSQIIQEINLYRLRDEVVHGPYSFTNFDLETITADGHVIFTDCQINSQAVYSARTGAVVGNTATARLAEQVVVYHPGPDIWQVADDNAVTSGAAGICAS
jgi:hypothetical protein